jgi:predicted phosphodiesterase
MRIAIISDIHGNLVALEAVLADAERFQPDQIVCLGDVALMGPQPHEAIARVRELGCPVVKGNADEWILDVRWAPKGESEDRQKMAEIHHWNADQLTDEDRAIIQSYQPTLEMPLEGGLSLFCYHGSPRSTMEGIFPATPPDELEPMLDGVTATILVGGHTHSQMARRHQRRLIINPGSIGLPMPATRLDVGDGAANPPWAEYALLTVEQGAIDVDLRSVPVEIAAITTAARKSGMPHAEWWASGWA